MKETLTIELSKEEIGEIIKQHVLKKHPKAKIDSVSFDFGTRLEGYYASEHEVAYFGGASVKLTE